MPSLAHQRRAPPPVGRQSVSPGRPEQQPARVRHLPDHLPWNIKFATVLADDSPYRPREVLAGKDARRLARELLGMSQAEFSAAFKDSPMKRAKLRGLERNAAVTLAGQRNSGRWSVPPISSP